jgi:hypothetical protein
MTYIDIGYSVNGLTVAEPFDDYDHPDCWWAKCQKGHRTFVTNEMLELGTVTCKECASDAAAYARLQERVKVADELMAAGNEYTDAYEALIAAERNEHDR